MFRSNGLSRRQLTLQTLFTRPERPMVQRRPARRRRPHQLGFGNGFARVDRCPSCAHALDGRRDCTECGTFVCAECDTFTSANGGDGHTCAGCAAF